MKQYKIAVIAGDGIGKEVVPEGIRVLEAAGRKFDIAFQFDEKPWSCDYFHEHGKMMPDDGLASIRQHDALYLGAVGFPGVPDLAHGASIPVYAIGGMKRGDLEEAWAAGAHGMAMIRGAWS